MQDVTKHSFHQAITAINCQNFSEAYQIIGSQACAEHLNFGNWLMQQQKPLDAANWYQYLLSENFAEPQLTYWCGVCYSAAGKQPQAEQFLNHAIASQPKSEFAYVALAQMYQNQGQFILADAILQKMLLQMPNNSQLLIQSGALFVESQEYAIASTYFEKAIAISPTEAMAYNDLANCYQHLGEFEKCHQMYTKALQLNANIAGAYLGLATCKKYSPADNSIHTFLDNAHQLTNNSEVDASYHFAKAKIYDDMKCYPQAWQQASDANKICNQHQKLFSISDWELNIERIIQQFSKLETFTKPLASTPIPVFIIGMPRSGTTLLEKILSGFEAVSIAGELDGFDHILASLTQNENPGIHYPKQLEPISPQKKQQLRDYYLQQLNAKAKPNSGWIVDKNPLNFIHLGLIQQLFPEAIFIHNKRHPMDILLSNYFQFFAHPNLSYSFNIETIIGFIKSYHRLMDHWLELSIESGAQILEIEYSEVVQNTESSVEILKHFLGTPNHHQQVDQKIITTASIWQARQPIYSSSIERWKNYQEALQPYTKSLQKWLL